MDITPAKQNQSLASKSISALKWNTLGRLIALIHRLTFVDKKVVIFAIGKSTCNKNIILRKPVY